MKFIVRINTLAYVTQVIEVEALNEELAIERVME